MTVYHEECTNELRWLTGKLQQKWYKYPYQEEGSHEMIDFDDKTVEWRDVRIEDD